MKFRKASEKLYYRLFYSSILNKYLTYFEDSRTLRKPMCGVTKIELREANGEHL